jgi:hypothetical protein
MRRKKNQTFSLIGFAGKTLVASGGLSLAILGSASAQSFPTLNVDPVCRGIVQQAATAGERGEPDLRYGQCLGSDMAMRRKLIRRWTRYTPSERANCIGSEAGGFASYTDLATCLEMARAAQKLNQ